VSPRCFEKIGTHAGLDRGLMNQCQKLAAPLIQSDLGICKVCKNDRFRTARVRI
jgi:hypothetical protein